LKPLIFLQQITMYYVYYSQKVNSNSENSISPIASQQILIAPTDKAVNSEVKFQSNFATINLLLLMSFNSARIP
jgi:hypothetical protein